MTNEDFQELELLNVKVDVWIDEEEYEKLYDCIAIEKTLKEKINKVFCGEQDFQSIFININDDNKEEYPEQSIQDIGSCKIETTNIKWRRLFFAKYLRAKIMQQGTDSYMKHLDELIVYLQRKLPYPYPQTNHEIILQHLYFQELSACGKPGLESLGFAIRAREEAIKGKTENGSASHYRFELYKLWARLNEGIGYWHSNQKMQAALAFSEVIRGFDYDNAAQCLQAKDEKVLWRSLLYDQAVLFRAELQEALQFSYHTIVTLQKLNDRKKENRLIKVALAYRDIGRMEMAKEKIIELLASQELKTNMDNIESFFKAFDTWGTRKNNIRKNSISKTRGLLFEYFLLKFEISWDKLQRLKQIEDKEVNYDIFKKDLESLSNKFPNYIDPNNKGAVLQIKNERTRYYQQIARFLKLLSEFHKNSKPEDKYYQDTIIKNLYEKIKEYILPEKKENGVKLKDFDKYDYDRYADSLEKFYRNLDSKDYIEDEKYFLGALNDYEREKFLLYRFKELERHQRINRLKNHLDERKCVSCFSEPEDRKAFDGLLGNCPIKQQNILSSCCLFGTIRNPVRNHSLSQSPHADIRTLEANIYEGIMKQENEHFLARLQYRSSHHLYSDSTQKSYHFVGLQRWNSQTPTLTLSLGGGYLLYKQDEKGSVTLGIAIDPGFDFVKNLFHMGFTLNDIDFILISHAHSDHIRDFEPIVSSLLDLTKRVKGSEKKIHAIMSLGVYRKLEHIINNTTLREFLADTYIVDIDKEIYPPDNKKKPPSFEFKRSSKNGSKDVFESIIRDKENEEGELKITPTIAYHNDYSERSDSFGYVIDFIDHKNGKEGGDPVYSFGYTGDTKWEEKIPEQYEKCDAVCIHLGALIESESVNEEKKKFSYYRGPQCEKLIEKAKHPYLFGLLRFIKSIKENKGNKNEGNKNKLILISEFGEELKGGIRIDLIKRLNRIFENETCKRVCLPVDIGLNVILARQEKLPEKELEWIKPDCKERHYKVWCYGCKRFVDALNIQYRHFGYGMDEALFYFCDVCLKSKPENIIQEEMRMICEVGLPLQKAHE